MPEITKIKAQQMPNLKIMTFYTALSMLFIADKAFYGFSILKSNILYYTIFYAFVPDIFPSSYCYVLCFCVMYLGRYLKEIPSALLIGEGISFKYGSKIHFILCYPIKKADSRYFEVQS